MLVYSLNKTVPQRISWLGILRSPRPLIMVRLIRSLLKIQLPKSRISQIFKSQKFSFITFLVHEEITVFSIQALKSTSVQCDYIFFILHVPLWYFGCTVFWPDGLPLCQKRN